MEKFRTFVKEGLYAQANPQANLTKKQRQALASPAARAKPKDKVTLPVPPWEKKKKKTDEGYGMPPKAAAHKARMDAKFGKVTTLKKGDPRIKAIQDVQKRKEKAFKDLSKKEEATEEGIVNTLATKVAKKTRDPNTIRRLTHKAASAVANATDGKEKRCESVEGKTKEGYVSHAQRKAVWASKADKKKKMKEAINHDDAHTDAQQHSNGSMSVKKI